jgi:hypothetical protein
MSLPLEWITIGYTIRVSSNQYLDTKHNNTEHKDSQSNDIQYNRLSLLGSKPIMSLCLEWITIGYTIRVSSNQYLDTYHNNTEHKDTQSNDIQYNRLSLLGSKPIRSLRLEWITIGYTTSTLILSILTLRIFVCHCQLIQSYSNICE